MSSAAGIEAFWSWWNDHRDELETWVGTGPESPLVKAIADRVHDIDPSLGFEFGKGRTAQHALALTGGGDPRLRLLAERWRAMGPGDDDVFEFHCARQPVPDPTPLQIQLGPATVDFGELRFDVQPDEARQRLEVVMHHPAFAGLPDEVGDQLRFVLIDNILGEDAVETWLASIDLSGEPAPAGALQPLELRERVEGLAAIWPGDAWVGGQGADPDTGQPLVAVANLSAKRWHHPFHDTLCLVTVPYDARDDGLPVPHEADRISAFIDAIEAVEDGLMLARITGAERMQIWLYLPGETGPAREAVDAVAARHPGTRLQFSWDPTWNLPL